MSKKVLISGVKPTGRPHIGNYFGALKQIVGLQDKYQSFIFIADYHALTTLHNPKELSENALAIAVDYLALGLDPEKVALFKQSDVPELTELAWIFNCITTVPYLMRSHAYKDAVAKEKEATVGTFDYPLLMAADILIQDADIVPVGEDQRQHVEYARDTAEKFNRTFGEIFKLPQAYILDKVKTVPGTDGKKMSKSYGNTIELFASDDEIKKAIMSVTTDSKGVDEPKNPEQSTLVSLHELFSPKAVEIRERYEKGGMSYKESKEILIKDMITFISPLREKRKEIEKDKEKVKRILEKGGEAARARAKKKLKEVKKLTGLM